MVINFSISFIMQNYLLSNSYFQSPTLSRTFFFVLSLAWVSGRKADKLLVSQIGYTTLYRTVAFKLQIICSLPYIYVYVSTVLLFCSDIMYNIFNHLDFFLVLFWTNYRTTNWKWPWTSPQYLFCVLIVLVFM